MNEPHRLWKTVVVLGAVTGLALVFITPPFQVPDEGAHFFRAFQTSTFELGLEQREGRIGADLPRALRDFVDLYRDIPLNPERKFNQELLTRSWSVSDDRQERVFTGTILPYPPAAYAAQAGGIAIGRIFSPRPIVWFYVARIVNLALFLLIVACTIRLTPDMQWGLALLALMPMTLYQAASISADGFTIAVSFLMIAFFLHCMTGAGLLTRNQIGFMFIGTALLALAKPGYLPLVLLALLVPTARFGTMRRRLAAVGGVLLAATIIGVASIAFLHDKVIGLPGSDSAAQLEYIGSHPFAYIAICLRCIFRASQYGSFIGWFGWLELRLPQWIIITYWLLLIAVPLTRRRPILTRRQWAFIAVLYALLVAVIFTIQYLSYTPVAKRSIDSVQGRYFIPFAPLLLLLFTGRRVPFSIDDHRWARRCLIGFIVFTHGVMAALLIKRYYPV